MSAVSTLIDAPLDSVFDVLCDPRALHYFVAGARTVRRFDPRWPDPGTAIDHTIGVAPLVLRDRTVAIECESNRRLLFEAHAHLLGVFRIEFLLEPNGSATTLRVDERAIAGPFSKSLPRIVGDVLLSLRNLEMCRRMRHLVLVREGQRSLEGARA